MIIFWLETDGHLSVFLASLSCGLGWSRLREGGSSMAQAVRKVTAKDTNEKLAHRRLTVLELAERLGNVTEACRRGGIDRTSFYDRMARPVGKR